MSYLGNGQVACDGCRASITSLMTTGEGRGPAERPEGKP